MGLDITGQDIADLLAATKCASGGRHAYYRSLRAFYNWLYSARSGFGLNPQRNPIRQVDSPKVPRKILPSLSQDDLKLLIDKVDNARDKAIISLFTESGLRLTELANVTFKDIDWSNRTIRTVGKGNKEALAPLGEQSERHLRAWLAEYQPNGSNIWGVNRWRIVTIMRNLKAQTGLPCNPHTFRRTFASILAKRGVDSLHIMRLGRWESLAMVELYTRSVKFEDSLKLYQSILV